MRDSIWTRLRRYAGVLPLFPRAAKKFGVSTFAVLRRAVALYRRFGIGANELFLNPLIDPRVSFDGHSGGIGKRRLLAIQSRINPIRWHCLVEDKATFYIYCKAVGLPVPKLYGVFDRLAGRLADGRFVSDRRDWERFFEIDAPQEFIVKPALGVYGRGLALYRRTGSSFEDHAGQIYSAGSLYEHLATDANYSRFVIQERVVNHPEIQRLTETRSLQTARIATWVTDEGNVEIYHTLFKLIVSENLSDNFNFGRSGNLVANIDPESGILAAPLAASPDRIGCQVVPVHPTSGIAVAGVTLPHWALARQLAERAARLFLPLRTIGWDIALTADGPVLMEGNASWDPFSHLAAGPHASEHREKELGRFILRISGKT